MIRKVIEIDEERCNGCGICADACHEGAIKIVGGKAKLVRDDFCDGFAPSHRVGLVRQFHCWEVAAEYAYKTQYSNGEKEHSPNFRITARLLKLEGPLTRPSGGMIAAGQAMQRD